MSYVLCLMHTYTGGELDFAQIYRNINQHGIELLSTLLHEVAHALTWSDYAHGPLWASTNRRVLQLFYKAPRSPMLKRMSSVIGKDIAEHIYVSVWGQPHIKFVSGQTN